MSVTFWNMRRRLQETTKVEAQKVETRPTVITPPVVEETVEEEIVMYKEEITEPKKTVNRKRK